MYFVWTGTNGLDVEFSGFPCFEHEKVGFRKHVSADRVASLIKGHRQPLYYAIGLIITYQT